MMRLLEDAHPLYARWYQKAYSREDALKKRIHADRERLVRRIAPKHRREAKHGHSSHIYGWNGAPDDQAMSFGVFCNGTRPNDHNSAETDLPPPSPAVADLYEVDCLLRVLTALVRAWEPDCADLSTFAFTDAVYDAHDRPAGPLPRVGWLTYLAAWRLERLPAALPCEIVTVPGHGALFVLTRDHRVSADNPDDVAAGRALREVLTDAGALHPIPGTIYADGAADAPAEPEPDPP